jgi:hypothetical protein
MCDIIALNIHAPTEDKIGDVKDSFYEELESVFNKLPTYNMKILLGEINAKVGSENTFKLTIWNESLHEIRNDHGVRVVKYAKSKNLTAKNIMFLHCNIHKFTWISPDGKPHNHIDHTLIDRQQHSCVLEAGSFRAVDCDTDDYLVVENMLKNYFTQLLNIHVLSDVN